MARSSAAGRCRVFREHSIAAVQKAFAGKASFAGRATPWEMPRHPAPLVFLRLRGLCLGRLPLGDLRAEFAGVEVQHRFQPVDVHRKIQRGFV